MAKLESRHELLNLFNLTDTESFRFSQIKLSSPQQQTKIHDYIFQWFKLWHFYCAVHVVSNF